MKKIITAITLAIALIAVPVCYRLFADKSLTPKNGLSVCAKALTTKECLETFGKNGDKLLKDKKPIQPIRVDVTNMGHKNISTQLKKATVKLASQKKVHHRIIKKNYNPLKVLGLGAGIFLGGLATLIGSLYCPLMSTVTIGITNNGGIILIPSLFILVPPAALVATLAGPPIGMAIYASKLGKKRKKAVQKLFGSEQFTLEPGQTQTMYLFVEHKNFKENIELTFKDGNDNEKTFSCYVSLA